jgi:hypothetical protein
MSMVRRVGAGVVSLAFLFTPVVALATPLSYSSSAHGGAIAYQNLKLPNGNTATVFADGVAEVFTKSHKEVSTQLVAADPQLDNTRPRYALPDRGEIIAQLAASRPQPYAASRVVVVYREGVTAPRDIVTVDKQTLRMLREAVSKHTMLSAGVPSYTNDLSVNRALASIGVDRSERLFRQFDRSKLAALQSGVAGPGRGLDLANVYRLHVSASSVPNAVAVLAKEPSVAYVAPDWTVSTMHTQASPVSMQNVRAAREHASELAYRPMHAELHRDLGSTSNLPTNYALTASAQSLLNSPSVDVAAAYDEIASRFNQIPGKGETITDVSIGDVDDASAASNPNDPCNFYVSAYGPTTEIVAGQRYLNLPSMPLIATYTADATGDLNGTGEVCGSDPYDVEIDLDFAAMAPLPHNLQRAGEVGSGYTDLLGVAPGATYRLVVPDVASPTISDIDAEFLGAALQTPRPNVITGSIGFGEDQYGFPSRFLEEDPLSQAIIQAIVYTYQIPVCISAGDGTRTFTTVAIGPSGGSAATDVVPPGSTGTNLNDDYLSTIPSLVFDSGSIDAGGTTLDDIFANPPQYATNPQVIAQHAYAETRWDGFTTFSSGFGSRVNVSAPSDNILSFEHTFGGGDDAVTVIEEGGTSASAPETAAVVAVVEQVSRLLGHPITNPYQIRKLLEQTGSPVLSVSQADTALNVGPQVNLRNVVESLLDQGSGSWHHSSGVARVAVEQRRDEGELNGEFLSDTNPAAIDLANGTRPGSDELSWITIAPDWEFVSPHSSYKLYVTGHSNKVLATTPWARLLPNTILQAAGVTIPSSSSQTVQMTYEAQGGGKPVTTNFALTFGPSVTTEYFSLAPKVPSVVTGSTIPVTYNVSNVGSNLQSPELIVSEPGRVDPDSGALFHPVYTAALPSATSGTVNVPVSALQGGGVYGVGIEIDTVNGIYSNFAFTRVAAPGAASHSVSASGWGVEGRPVAPLLSSSGSTPGHLLTIPYGASFQAQYNVHNVPGANGAIIEVSAAGPGAWGSYNPFNNPNGSIRDDNGVDSGSTYFQPVSGTSGTATISGKTANLYAALNQVVRVFPTRDGKIIGEGGDVSTITMNGVYALDGGYVDNGFGVNAAGSDGFITSGQELASGEIITSLETFNQNTNAITDNVASGSNSLYYTNGWGQYGNDIGLFCDENEQTSASTCNLLNTVSSGTIGSAWSPTGLPSTFFIDEGAANTANDTGAFYGYNSATSSYGLFTSNLVANTNSALYNIEPTGLTIPEYWGFAENTTTNTGVLPLDDIANPNTAPTIVLVNLTNGTMSSFTGLGLSFPYGIAVDSTSNKAAVPTLGDAGFTIYNLATQSGNEVIMPQPPTNGGGNGLYTAADPTHSEFLVEQTTAPDYQSNNNSLSRVLAYDENGNLLSAQERFDLWDSFVSIATNNLQLNPSLRLGYLVGPGLQQLIPFSY